MAERTAMYTSRRTTMDENLRQQLDRARGMSGEEKLRESLQLFERTSRLMRDGLRNEQPELSDRELLRLLYERLAANRALEGSMSMP